MLIFSKSAPKVPLPGNIESFAFWGKTVHQSQILFSSDLPVLELSPACPDGFICQYLPPLQISLHVVKFSPISASMRAWTLVLRSPSLKLAQVPHGNYYCYCCLCMGAWLSWHPVYLEPWGRWGGSGCGLINAGGSEVMSYTYASSASYLYTGLLKRTYLHELGKQKWDDRNQRFRSTAEAKSMDQIRIRNI